MDTSNIPDELKSIFKAEEDVLSAELKRARAKHDHGRLKGDIGEDVVLAWLKNYLPSTYEFANGEIVDSVGGRSNEVDIAICSPAHPFTFSKDGIGILFVEGVDAVIESKATLSSTAFGQAVNNCRSVRELNAEIPHGTTIISENSSPGKRIELTPHGVFAFDSELKIKTIRDKLEETRTEIPEDETIDMVYVLKEGLVVKDRKIDRLQVNDGTSESYEIVDVDPPLLGFLAYLQDKMPTPIAPRNPLPSYFD